MIQKQEAKKLKNLTEKTVDSLKEIIENSEIVDEEKLKLYPKIQEKAIIDNLYLGRLALETYSILKANLFRFEEEDLAEYLNQFNFEELRKTIADYRDGNEIGDYYLKIKISELVEDQRIECENIIGAFFRIFGEEE